MPPTATFVELPAHQHVSI